MKGKHERAVRSIDLGWFSSVSTLMLVILGGSYMTEKRERAMAALVLQVLSLLKGKHERAQLL